jgi:hypothetical protein
MVSATRAILVSQVATDAGDKRRLSCGIERFLGEIASLARLRDGSRRRANG